MSNPLRIDIVSDTVCPWCYVGKRHLEAALAQRPEVAVDCHWQPFQLNPDMPMAGVDRKTHWKQKFGDSARLEGMVQQLKQTGEALGLKFAFDGISWQPNTLKSHALIHHFDGQWEQQNQVKELILHSFFIDGHNIGDDAVLIEIAHRSGLPEQTAEQILSADMTSVKALDQRFRQMGVSGVPTFIFDGKAALVGAQPVEALVRMIDELRPPAG